ncbi:caspase family protein, partial [Elusimicrobiota bacterium]
AFTPDGKRLLTGGLDKKVRVWNARRGRLLETLETKEWARNTAISPDGQFLGTNGPDNTVALWDLSTGKRIRTFRGHKDKVDTIVFTPDGRHLVSGVGADKIADHLNDTSIRVWDVISGRSVRVLKGHERGVGKVAVTPDGKRIVSSGRDQAIRVWDFATGRELMTLRGHPSLPDSLAVSPDGNLLASASSGETTRFWDLKSGKELCRLYSAGKEWLVVTREGYFDGTPGGMKMIRWTVGLESFPLDAFYEGYYVPGLLSRVLAGDRIATAGQKSVSEGFALPPKVRITSPADGAAPDTEEIEVKVTAADQGGGVDEIRLYHNGRALGAKTRGIAIKGRGKGRTKIFRVALADGVNHLRAMALSRDRIEGNPHEITVTHKGTPKKPVLHLLAVGINAYENPSLNLNFAKSDASAMAGFFGSGAKRLFSKVIKREIYDAEATKPRIVAALEGLRATRPEDVVFLYLAGHGDVLGQTWYFVPHELVYPGKEEKLKSMGLSSTEILDHIGRIQARKVVVVFDACKSGAVVATRGIEEEKTLRQMARASGTHIVSASNKDQYASELKDLGHGVFTYTFLQALGGKADANKDGVVTVRELLPYIEDRLPEVSRKYKTQPQYPVVESRGMDFPIAASK